MFLERSVLSHFEDISTHDQSLQCKTEKQSLVWTPMGVEVGKYNLPKQHNFHLRGVVSILGTSRGAIRKKWEGGTSKISIVTHILFMCMHIFGHNYCASVFWVFLHTRWNLLWNIKNVKKTSNMELTINLEMFYCTSPVDPILCFLRLFLGDVPKVNNTHLSLGRAGGWRTQMRCKKKKSLRKK